MSARKRSGRGPASIALAPGSGYAAAIETPDTRAVCIARAGCRGYWLIQLCDDALTASIARASINSALGVTAQQVAAIQAGSMFGFDCPAADPASYDATGAMIPMDKNAHG